MRKQEERMRRDVKAAYYFKKKEINSSVCTMMMQNISHNVLLCLLIVLPPHMPLPQEESSESVLMFQITKAQHNLKILQILMRLEDTYIQCSYDKTFSGYLIIMFEIFRVF